MDKEKMNEIKSILREKIESEYKQKIEALDLLFPDKIGAAPIIKVESTYGKEPQKKRRGRNPGIKRQGPHTTTKKKYQQSSAEAQVANVGRDPSYDDVRAAKKKISNPTYSCRLTEAQQKALDATKNVGYESLTMAQRRQICQIAIDVMGQPPIEKEEDGEQE